MTNHIQVARVEGRRVRLMVGNTPVNAQVSELSGLSLRLALSASIAAVPRVRVEFEDIEEGLSSLQLQGMVTGRDAEHVTVTLERLMIAAGREQVDAILKAWFMAVPRLESCYQPMMRGYGYELRKAILSGRSEAPHQSRPLVKPRPHDPSKDTLDGFPPVAVRAGMLNAEVSLPSDTTQSTRSLVEAPPTSPSLPEKRLQRVEPLTPRRVPRGALSPQVSRTGLRLLDGTQGLDLPLDCSADGAGYGRAFLYRLAHSGRLGFVACKGVRPGFGARIELITDVEIDGITHTLRIATSVVWVAADPDYPAVSLMALRLAPTNQPGDLRRWDACCQAALAASTQERAVGLLPSRQRIEGLDV